MNQSKQSTKPPASTTDSSCGRGALTPHGASAKLWRRVRAPVPHQTSTEAPPIVHDVLRSPGQPLDPGTRAFMEPRFGYDFSRVRVHADSRAAKSAEAVNAQAYTAGSNIVFGSNQGGAGNMSNQRLLAHELAHVVQQDGRRSGGSLQVAPANDSAEGVADRAADQVLSGGREPTRTAQQKTGSAATLQRRPVTTDLPTVAQYGGGPARNSARPTPGSTKPTSASATSRRRGILPAASISAGVFRPLGRSRSGRATSTISSGWSKRLGKTNFHW